MRRCPKCGRRTTRLLQSAADGRVYADCLYCNYVWPIRVIKGTSTKRTQCLLNARIKDDMSTTDES